MIVRSQVTKQPNKRMDDPESEWEIQESSRANSDDGKLGWILRLGRKILVTGIVISSAPLVLPPLMAISAIGFVCSVPYGIFLVSYACSETVMSRLLPMPSPAAPLLLEYRKAFNGEEEANGEENQGEQNELIKGGISIEREEEELKEDTIKEVEMRIEIVDKDKGELDKGNILQESAYQKGGIGNDEKKSMGEVDEIVEENGYEEDDVEFLDKEDVRPFQSFEVEVKAITESKVEQPIIEEIRIEQPADEGQGVDTVVEGGEKNSSNIEKETPMEAENVKAKEELVRETRQNVEHVCAQRKPKKKTKLKIEKSTKWKGKQSIKESSNELPGDEIHVFFTIIEGDKKERDNVTAAELKNVAVHVENDELVRDSRGLLERNRGKGSSRDVAEDKQGVEKAQVDGDEKNGSNVEKETPFQIKKVDVQLSQSTDIEEDEEIVRETRGLLERIRDEGKTDFAVDDKWSTEKEHVSTEKDDKKIVEDVEKAKTRCILAHDGIKRPTREFETKVEENKADNKEKMKESVENLGAFSKDTKLGKDAEGLSEEMDVDNISRRAQSVVPVSETVNDGYSTKELTVESAILVEGGKAEDDNEKNVEQNYLLNKEKKDVIFSNEDEEQGLGLLEDLSIVSQQGSPSGVNTFEDLLVSTKAQESDDIRISEENAIDTASNEALYSEKIREQLNALRTIVGYKAARKETFLEELKALYLFTGIEPPASFKDTSDLAEVNAKLRYLKSIVGVK
ncbi:hypothetical protein CRYUN_Cryun05aG0063600 [Craigia yunnanensis]